MGQLSECDAYKQLLEITENIINSLTSEEDIMRKYETLKKSILSKVPPSSGSTSLSQLASKKLLAAYKSLVEQILQGIVCFQFQIEGQMNKTSFLRNSKKIVEKVEQQNRVLSEELGKVGENSRNLKLMLKEESNAFKYVTKEFEGKLENMGLMIEVHRKMHEIIMEASDKEVRRTQKQMQACQKMSEMQKTVQQISNIKSFIDSYDITQQKAKRFEQARKGLAKVLFEM